MKQDNYVARLEFIAAFFEIPDQSLLALIYEGKTPLGICHEGKSQEDFELDLATTITSLFVNSRDPRPIYPLASELGCSSEADCASLQAALLREFESSHMVPSRYPPDHITVLCEFTLYLLHQKRNEEAADFYARFVGAWIDNLSSAIEERNASLPIRRLASLLRDMAMIDQVVHQ